MKPVGIVGNYNIDIAISNVQELPQWDTEIMANRFERPLAGTSGYMALALDGLGISSVILSCVGADEPGDYLIETLRIKGMIVEGIIQMTDQQTQTGFVIVHHDGSRAIISVSGAHDYYNLEMYRQKRHLLADCEEIVICGSYLLPKFTVAEALDAAKEQRNLGKKFSSILVGPKQMAA